MEVKPHVILLLDILGYKDLIKNSSDSKSENDYLEEVHGLMSMISSFIECRNQQIDASDEYDLKLSRFKSLIFSDNIIFFAPYASETDMINLSGNLIYGISEFLFLYPKSDLFFRGAITEGLLYYDDIMHFVFGSGLIRAYELESNEAIFPRVIIDDRLKPSPVLLGYEQDVNEKWYIDYLTLAYEILRNDKFGASLIPIEKTIAHIEQFKNSIQIALKKYQDNQKVLEKYMWLAKYYNQFCYNKKLDKYIIDLIL